MKPNLDLFLNLNYLFFAETQGAEEYKTWERRRGYFDSKFNTEKHPAHENCKARKEKYKFSNVFSNTSELSTMGDEHRFLQNQVTGSSCRYASSCNAPDSVNSSGYPIGMKCAVNQRTPACAYNYRKSYLTSS